MEKKALQIRIEGKVQGVWFRASAQQKAQELGICGTVTNLPDGAVYIEAEGTQEQLDALLEWCKDGPPHAQVTRILIEPHIVMGFASFEIIR